MSNSNEYKTGFFKGLSTFFSDAGVFFKEASIRAKHDTSVFFLTIRRWSVTIMGLGLSPKVIDPILEAHGVTLPEWLHSWIITAFGALAAGAAIVTLFPVKGTPVNEAKEETNPKTPILPVLPFTAKKEAEEKAEGENQSA